MTTRPRATPPLLRNLNERTVLDSIRAGYATSWAELDAFAIRRRVAVFVANADCYDDARRPRLREPFGTFEASLAVAGKVAGFVLANPPAERILFRRGRYTVVRLGP